MIIYEVNHLGIKADIYEKYRIWLQKHVAEILGLPGFLMADTFDSRDMEGDSMSLDVCIHYYLRADADLDRYLLVDARRMRAEGEKLFPQGSRIYRRTLSPTTEIHE